MGEMNALSTAERPTSIISFWHSLRGRFVTLLVLFSLVPVVVYAIFSSAGEEQNDEKYVVEQLESYTAVQSTAVDTWLEDIESDARALAGLSAIQSGETGQMQDMLDVLLSGWEGYSTLFVADAGGEVRVHSGMEIQSETVTPLLQQSIDGLHVVSQVLPHAGDSAGFVVAAPIEQGGGVSGVAGIFVPLSQAGMFLQAPDIDRPTMVTLIDNKGQIVASSVPADNPAETMTDGQVLESDAARQVLQGETASGVYLNQENVEVTGAYAPIPSTGWGIIVECERSAVLPGPAGRNRLVIISAVLLPVSILLALLLTWRMTANLNLLNHSARLLDRGNLEDILKNFSGKNRKIRSDTPLHQTIRHLHESIENLDRLAKGEFDISITPRSEKDSLGLAIQKLQTSLHNNLGFMKESSTTIYNAAMNLNRSAKDNNDIIQQVATTIQQVATGTQQQTASISKTVTSVEQVSRAIDGVAKGAQEQASAVAKASTITHEMAANLQKVAQNAGTVQQNADNAAQVARQGTQTVEETVQGMQSIKAKMDISSQKMTEMSERSKQISTILEKIQDISSQTNLLALNAAIEAARAGEHGKGFAVVASEVRKLAVSSAESATEIHEIIEGIHQAVSEAISAMQESNHEVEQGVLLANQAGQSLEDIYNSVNTVYQRAGNTVQFATGMANSANELVAAMDTVSAVVEENTAATEQMSASSAEMTESIENIASISQENSAAIEEVSAFTENMNAQSEEFVSIIQDLAQLSTQLLEVVDSITGRSTPSQS